MADATKKKKTISPEHKAKLDAGRERARQAALEAKNAADAMLESSHDPVSKVMPVPDGVVVPKREVAEEAPVPTPETPENENLLDMITSMQRQIDELTKANAGMSRDGNQAVQMVAEMTGANIGQQGVQGRVFRYPVETSYYPSPVDRLYDDPALRRFALRENFYIKWEVTGETYEKYGVTYTEPRFTVEIWRYLFDDETGEPTGEMFLVNRQIQHEDELIARLSADKLGISFGEGQKLETFEDLMHEMRYWRIRQWLLSVFKPFRASQIKNKKIQQRVIGGRVVEVTDNEVLVDGASGIEAAHAMETEVQLSPAEQREAQRAGLL